MRVEDKSSKLEGISTNTPHRTELVLNRARQVIKALPFKHGWELRWAGIWALIATTVGQVCCFCRLDVYVTWKDERLQAYELLLEATAHRHAVRRRSEGILIDYDRDSSLLSGICKFIVLVTLIWLKVSLVQLLTHLSELFILHPYAPCLDFVFALHARKWICVRVCKQVCTFTNPVQEEAVLDSFCLNFHIPWYLKSSICIIQRGLLLHFNINSSE